MRKHNSLPTIDEIKQRCRVDSNGCWNWQGSVTGSKDPRPDIRIRGKHWYVSRWVWFIAHGNLTEELLICHTCDNGLCLNPRHLYEATQTQNMRDASARGRFPGKVSMDVELVAKIHQLRKAGFTLKAISELLGIPHGTVGAISCGSRQK